MILAEHELGSWVALAITVALLLVVWVTTAMVLLVVGIVAARRLRRSPETFLRPSRSARWLIVPVVLSLILALAGATFAAREAGPSLEQDPSFDPIYVSKPQLMLIHEIQESSNLTSPPIRGGGLNGSGELLAWIEDRGIEGKWFDTLVIYDMRQQLVVASTGLPFAKPPNQMAWISEDRFAAEELMDGVPGQDAPTQLWVASGPGWEMNSQGIQPFPTKDPRPTCKTGLISHDGDYCSDFEFYNDRAYHGYSQNDLLITRAGKRIARFNGYSLQGWAANGDLVVEHDGLYSIPRSYLDALGNKALAR